MTQQDRPVVTVSGPGGTGAFDVLGGPDLPERHTDRRTVLAAVVGVAGVAVAGTGVALALALSGGGAQPESALPADAFAMARVDLDPAAGQKLAAYELSKRFPDLGVEGARSLPDDLLRGLLGEEQEVDVERQVEPWIGARAAVAGVPDSTGDGVPELLVAVAVDDRRAAERLLPDLLEDGALGSARFFAFSEREDYVLLSDSQQAADAAAGTERVLADVEAFRDDVDGLEGDQVAVAWADLTAGWEALPGEAKEAARSVYGEQLVPSGRTVAGVHLEDDAVELTGRSVGLDLGDDALTAYAVGVEGGGGLVADLPSGAVAALSVAGLGEQVESLLSVVGGATGVGVGVTGEDQLDLLGETLGLDVPDELPLLFGEETAGAVYDVDGSQEVALRSRGGDLDVARRALAAVERQVATSSAGLTFEQCLELSSPTDEALVLPDEQVDGLTEQELQELAEDGVVVGDPLPVPIDEEACGDLPREADLPPSAPADLGEVDGLRDGVGFATTDRLLDALSSGTRLADDDRFEDAVEDPDRAATVFYADLQAAFALFGGTDPALEPLDAIGGATTGGPDGRFRVRLTLR